MYRVSYRTAISNHQHATQPNPYAVPIHSLTQYPWYIPQNLKRQPKTEPKSSKSLLTPSLLFPFDHIHITITPNPTPTSIFHFHTCTSGNLNALPVNMGSAGSDCVGEAFCDVVVVVVPSVDPLGIASSVLILLPELDETAAEDKVVEMDMERLVDGAGTWYVVFPVPLARGRLWLAVPCTTERWVEEQFCGDEVG
jgi:hypothetical protein